MVRLTAKQTSYILMDIADALERRADEIILANKHDLARMDPNDPKYDRLMLTEDRIIAIAGDTRNVATLPAPCGEIIEETMRPNGLKLSKIRVPLGVVGVIYEARPNVTVDVFSLCLRSQNAVVLKGGKDAQDSNIAIVQIIHDVLKNNDVDTNILQLLSADREATNELMQAVNYVDVLIPRGSQGLINAVRENSKIPVIETGAGVVHTYFDKDGRKDYARDIVCNAKTRRVSVCNALDCLIVHKDKLSELPYVCEPLAEKKVEIYADERAYRAIESSYPSELLKHASAEDFGREFLSLKMAIRTVDNLDEALDHIYTYGLRHSEAIVTDNDQTAQRFLSEVDAACVYHNAPTSFTDGAQFGLGAEIGISTQKLHARGPMALRELTSYKWLIKGEGQIRS